MLPQTWSRKALNAGTYTVSLQENQFSVTGDELFKYDVILDIIDPTVAVEITKRQLTLTSATDTKVYDGTPLTNNTVDVTGDGWANGEGATYDVTGTQTDVGMSDNTFTYSLNAGTLAENYDIEVKAGTLSVTEAPLVSVTVTKAWDDSNNEAGKRPDSITVKLLANGEDTGKTLVLTEASEWEGIFEDLDPYIDGKEVLYSVDELPVQDYVAHIAKNDMETGYVITNCYSA